MTVLHPLKQLLDFANIAFSDFYEMRGMGMGIGIGGGGHTPASNSPPCRAHGSREKSQV